ncbi:hypothetical protein BC628DRAFT_300130 [Trametes gibbosa]|nr:hypothetical protein BC628DRAFT_300130 [Trametes gibbosa]
MNATSAPASNSADPNQQIATPVEGPQAVQNVSQALVQGALELSAIVEKRIARIRADYQGQINALTQQVNALIAQKNVSVRSAEHDALMREVENLRRESESWRQDRAGWERAHVEFENARTNWQHDRNALLEDRERLNKECETLRTTLEESQRERDALQQQLQTSQRENDEKIRQAVASAVHELETRARWSEATQPVSTPEQNAVLDSPQRLQEYPTMSSTLGTIASTRFPSPHDVSMQHDNIPVDREASPQSPTVTLHGGQSPPESPRIRVPGASLQGSRAARLVIRVPPPTGPVRKPIKPPVSPPTKEELQTIARVPIQRDSSDHGSPAKASDASTSSGSSSTSSSSP